MKKIVSVLLVGISMLFLTTATAQVKKKPVTSKVKITDSKKTTVNPKTTTGEVKEVKVAGVKNQVKRKTTLGKKDNSIKIKITTDSGVIIVKLYDSTPLHRDNFVKLVNEKFYDSLLFHRVISGFMIQGGDPTSKTAEPGAMLGSGGGGMARIPAEFKPSIIHKKGTLCAARDGNPEMASSACQFYLVQGTVFGDQQLDQMDMNRLVKYTPEQRMLYKTIGGTPMLDMQYTVFGEVIKGLNVIDKIASVQKGMADRPVGDVRMKMELIK
jgi:cyclophilin family peptidyl-prolyl cis-trans isomerase